MTQRKKRRPSKRFEVGQADLQPGQRRLVDVEGKSIGICYVNGDYYALHNRCPHLAGAWCAGPVTGTALPVDGYEYVYGRAGEILRCAWHGWEFEIASGQCLSDPKMRARTYQVAVEDGHLILYI